MVYYCDFLSLMLCCCCFALLKVSRSFALRHITEVRLRKGHGQSTLITDAAPAGGGNSGQRVKILEIMVSAAAAAVVRNGGGGGGGFGADNDLAPAGVGRSGKSFSAAGASAASAGTAAASFEIGIQEEGRLMLVLALLLQLMR